MKTKVETNVTALEQVDCETRSQELARKLHNENHRKLDKMFVLLMGIQWIAGIITALFVSPYTWIGEHALVHTHVWTAIFLGGIISSAPMFLGIFHPGQAITRHVIAVSQAFWGALLIHLSGGRIETHFHVFGSLAFIAFYRDWKVLLTMTVVVAADHAIRGIFFPLSVYGIVMESPFRWIEHAAWVLFEDIILVGSCLRGQSEAMAVCRKQAELEHTNALIEEKVRVRSSELQDTKDFFQSVLDSIQAHICVLDKHGRIVETNAYWDKFAIDNGGLEGGIGSNYLETCRKVEGECEEGANQVADAIESVIQGQAAQYVSEYPCHSSTSKHWYQVNVSPLTNHKRGAAVVAHSEITERVIAKIELLEQSKHLSLLSLVAKYTDNAVVITDADGNIEWANEGFHRISEYTLEEVKGRKPGSFLQGELTDPQTVQYMRERLDQNKGFDVEIVNYTKSGTPYWLAVEVRPIRDAEGNVVKFIAIESDISDKKDKEQQMRLLRAAVDHAHDAVFIARRDASFVDVNQSACEQLGMTREELLSLGIPAIDRQGTHRSWIRHWRDVKANRISRVDAHLTRKDGSSFPVEISPVFVSHNGDEYICAFARDITERKLAEQDKEKLTRELDAQLASIDRSQARIEFDAYGTIIDVNQNFQEIMGYEQSDLIGQHHKILRSPEETAKASYKEHWEALRKGEFKNGEYKNVSRNGETKWIQATYNPVFGEDGTVEKVVKYATDVTAKKRTEQEKQALAVELQGAARQAGMAEVATGVLHNVGNVLNSVNVSTNLLHELTNSIPVGHLKKASDVIAEKEDELAEFLTHDNRGKHFPGLLKQLANNFDETRDSQLCEIRALAKNVEHIKEIVSMQQSFAKKSGIMELVAPCEVIEDALKINDASLIRHGVDIIRNYHDIPAIYMRRHDVIQIMINLIKNAKQAVDKSDVNVKEILISTRKDEEFVSIEVKDNGIGIAPENLKKVFQHGFTTKRTGHGFGLHSCANAAQEMGGSLSVRSEGVGKGATFHLRLPVKQESGKSTSNLPTNTESQSTFPTVDSNNQLTP